MTSPIAELVTDLQATFRSDRTRPLAWRKAQLQAIIRMIGENERVLLDALATDLGKPELEAWASELHAVTAEATYALKRVKGWMKPTRVTAALAMQPARAYRLPEPKGVVLLMGPWNYPLQLTLNPLVGAIAAGNCAVVKPSELAPATAKALGELIPRYLDTEAVRVVEGGIDVATELLKHRYEHIFYTGGANVGRVVLAAAAPHLTPVTLELGGKSPCIVAGNPNMEVTARRIAWGKFFNAGQTCVAPDYILVERHLQAPLLEALKTTLESFYQGDPKSSPDLARIVNDRHFERLTGLLEGQTVAHGGEHDASTRYIAPTLLTDVSPDSPVMQSEIFGPILPILPVDSVDEAVTFVRQFEKPLALYVFTQDDAIAESVLARTSSGSACVNECVSQTVGHSLPFGGVGESGMGAYHGKASFDTFTHMKSVLRKPFGMEPPLRYPPYTDGKLRWIKRLI